MDLTKTIAELAATLFCANSKVEEVTINNRENPRWLGYVGAT